MKEKDKKDELELLSKPADTMHECLIAKGITVDDLVKSYGFTAEEIESINNGDKIPFKVAGKLSNVLGVDTMFWVERDENYRNKLIELGVLIKCYRVDNGDSDIIHTDIKSAKEQVSIEIEESINGLLKEEDSCGITIDIVYMTQEEYNNLPN